MEKIEKDEFLAWREQPMTRWVLGKLREQATAEALALQEYLAGQVSQSATAWAEQQPQNSYRKGRCEGLMYAVEIAHEDLTEEAPTPEIESKQTGY